jgi:hypothetical protein
MKLARKEDHGGEGLVMFVYKYSGRGARMSRASSGDVVGQTPYKISTDVEEMVTLVGGPNKYMLLPCLKSAGAEGKFDISVTGSDFKPELRALGSKEKGASLTSSCVWTKELSGGYMKAANPQFLLELPEGKHQVDFTLKRTDGQHDQGLIVLVYKHTGDGELAEDDAALKSHKMVGKSDFKPTAEVSLKKSLDGFPEKYLVIPCLQKEGSEGPMSLTIDAEDCLPILTNLRKPDDLPAALEADLAAVEQKVKPKKMKKVALPPGICIHGRDEKKCSECSK